MVVLAEVKPTPCLFGVEADRMIRSWPWGVVFRSDWTATIVRGVP